MDSVTFRYGQKTVFEPGQPIYRQGEPLGAKPVLYLLAGLVKLEMTVLDGSRFTMYLQPESVFGLVEALSGCARLTHALAMEKSILIRWSREDFDLDLGPSWELTRSAITGLTRLLRILNAEFGERIGLRSGRA